MNQKHDINVVFHYIPLHSSPAGIRFGRADGSLGVTDDLNGRIVRLPLWIGLEKDQARVIDLVQRELERL